MTLLRHSEIYCAMIIIIYFNHLNARMAARDARHRFGGGTSSMATQT